MWQCDFRSKKSRELMASDEASEESEFLSAFNASLESFVHKILKDEQIECILRIVCHGRDILAMLPMGFGKSAIYQLIPKVLFHMGRTANATSKTTVAVVSLLDYIRKEQVASIEKMDCALRLLGNQSRETAKSRMESSTLCLEVLNNGLVIDGEKLCSLALFIRQRSLLSMKCILWQHGRFIYVVFI